MTSQGLLVGIASLTLGVGVWIAVSMPQGSSPAGGGADVEALEARLRAAEARADAIEEIRTEVRALRERLDRGAAAAPQADGRAGRAAPTSLLPGGSAEPGEPAADADFVEAVAERVAKKMDERLDRSDRRAGQYDGDGRWKAPIDDLATELALSESQKGDLKRFVDGGKDQTFALLQTQRLDGTTLLDDYVAALKGGGDPAAATQELFKRIFSERVPGSDQTYVGGILSIEAEVKGQVGRVLDAGQRQKLQRLRVAILEVGTGYDPTGDHVRAKLQ